MPNTKLLCLSSAGIKSFLMKYVDESALQRRQSQTEDDNPPSPMTVGGGASGGSSGVSGSGGSDGGAGTSANSEDKSGLKFHTPHTPPSNPLTPASPHNPGFLQSPPPPR